MSGCFPTGPRYLKSTNWLQDSFIIQKCHILWTITSFHFYGDIGRKIQKQKVLEWRENGGACALVKGLAYLTPKRQRPALTCASTSIHFRNRLLTKSNRKSSCGWSFAYWTRYQQRWEVWQSACQHYFYSNGYVPFHPGSPWMWRMRHWIPMTQRRNKESLRWRFILFCFDKIQIIFE